MIGQRLEQERQLTIKAGTYTPTTNVGPPTLLPPSLGRHGLSMDALRDAAVGIAPNADTKTNLAGKLWRAKNKVSSLFMMARRNEAHFGPSKPLLRLFEARAFMERTKDIILEKFGGLNATLSIARAERDHPEAMAKAKRVLFDLSLHDINPEGDNSHLGKDKLMGVQAKTRSSGCKKRGRTRLSTPFARPYRMREVLPGYPQRCFTGNNQQHPCRANIHRPGDPGPAHP